jgi:hypothetical protein
MSIRLRAIIFPLILTASPAIAESATSRSAIDQMIGEGETYACYSRVYDKDHLAGHPKQNVRAMKLLARLDVDGDQRTLVMTLGTGFRAFKREFVSYGSCREDAANGGALSCFIDCDGGHLAIRPGKGGAVLVEIPESVKISSGDNEFGALEDAPKGARFGADDKLFRLDIAPTTDCLPLANDEDKAAISKAKPRTK